MKWDWLGFSIGLMIIGVVELLISFLLEIISGTPFSHLPLIAGSAVIMTIGMVGICCSKEAEDDDVLYPLGFGCIAGIIGYVVLVGSFTSSFDFFIPWWLFIILTFVIGEVAFWLTKFKPKKGESRFWFTAKVKGLMLLISAIAIAIGVVIVNFIRWAIPWIAQYWEAIVMWLGYIGIGIVAILLFGFIAWAYIKLNSLKYREKKTVSRSIVWKKVGNRNLRYRDVHKRLHRDNEYHIHKVGSVEYKMEVI